MQSIRKLECDGKFYKSRGKVQYERLLTSLDIRWKKVLVAAEQGSGKMSNSTLVIAKSKSKEETIK